VGADFQGVYAERWRRVMTSEELKSHVFDALAEVAPEVNTNALDPAVSFRDQIEIDSVDFLNFVLNLEKRLNVKIPEGDYPELSSLHGCLSYLTATGHG
jgi:acyl carrier protein